jgi:hypothetical protein
VLGTSQGGVGVGGSDRRREAESGAVPGAGVEGGDGRRSQRWRRAPGSKVRGRCRVLGSGVVPVTGCRAQLGEAPDLETMTGTGKQSWGGGAGGDGDDRREGHDGAPVMVMAAHRKISAT